MPPSRTKTEHHEITTLDVIRLLTVTGEGCEEVAAHSSGMGVVVVSREGHAAGDGVGPFARHCANSTGGLSML